MDPRNFMLPKEIKSLWTATTPETSYPELKADAETDVVVIGGGIAGLNTAYFLAREGKKVIVVDSSRIATGTSGNTTAKITSQHNLKYAFLKRYLGLPKARIYAKSNQWAIQEIEKIIKDEKIECDFERLPAYVYALSPDDMPALEKELAVCLKLGLPASIVLKIESVPFPISGALKFENQAYFHPRKYLLALAGKIIQKGGQIFENTQALDIKKGEPVLVITDKRKIRAKNVVVATNYPFFDKGLFFLRTSQSRSYSMAVDNEKLPKGMFINDGEEDKILSFRPHLSADKKWLIVGGQGHAVGEDEKVDHFSNLEKSASKRFNFKNIEYIWSAQDSMPIDRVPFIGRMPFWKNVYVVTGFGKWGITTSFVAARIITDLISGRKNYWARLYKPSRFNLLASLGEIAKLIARSSKSYWRHFSKEEKFNLSDLKEGEGRVISYNKKKLAVYKDNQGKLQAYSAVCTHMGCIVGWNNSEKTWDCPCHGSRFNQNGSVRNGPAARSLPEYDKFK